MKGVYSDVIPLNARINIDYRGEKVGFAYPNKEESGKKRIHFSLILSPFIGWWVEKLTKYVFLPLAILGVFNLDMGLVGKVALFLTWGWGVGGFFISVFGIPAIAAMYVTLNYHKYSKWFPKFNMERQGGVWTKTFTSLESDTFELPLFDNVYLKYELVGEFAQFIDEVDVREHDFTYVDKDNHESPNELLWKASFKFSQPPKKGRMTVDFI